MNDKGILATYLMSPLPKVTNPETSSQFKLVKDFHSNRVNDLLIPIQFQLLYMTIFQLFVIQVNNSN